MTPEERRLILDQMEQARAAIRAEVKNLSDDQAAWRPDPSRWSIRDCVEHIALAEKMLLDLIQNRSYPFEPVTAGREDSYQRHVQNRARKFQAPDGVHPDGHLTSLEAALNAFDQARESSVHYIETVDDDLRARKTVHPVAGEVTCRECLGLLIGHPLRHLDQIREIMQTPGFPR